MTRRRFCRVFAVLACLAAAGLNTAAAAETELSYRGRLLRPDTGNGVPGVKILRFKAIGHLPATGKCRSDFRLLDVSDGAFSLKEALSRGFTPSPDNHLRICSDAQTGALSEKLDVNVAYYSGGNLVASYSWLSGDPRKGRAADSVIEFANIEYHVSLARHTGRLMVMTAE